MSQMKQKTQEIEKVQINQQKIIDHLTNVVKLMGQDTQGNHENIQEVFNRLEIIENKQRKNNIRLKNLKEKSDGNNLQEYIIDLLKSIIVSGTED